MSYPVIITRPDSNDLGGWQYPIPNEFGITDWVIVGNHVENPCNLCSPEYVAQIEGQIVPFLPEGEELPPYVFNPLAGDGYWTMGENKPTYRWVNGSTVNDFYAYNNGNLLTTEEFQKLTGFVIDMGKGGMVASKRISRVMRRMSVFGFFREDKVKVLYLEQDEFAKKVWDGAGLISRKMLMRLKPQIPKTLSKGRRESIERELKVIKRVEFTLQSKRGQDKGHLIVANDLGGYDLILPKDTKVQVKMLGNKVFLGIGFVHSGDNGRLDMQSLLNLTNREGQFFSEEYVLECLREHSEIFIEAVQTGKVDLALSKIDNVESVDDLGDWYVREFLACGGKAMHMASLVRALIGQHLKSLNHTQLAKMRLPVNLGRYYVMPIGVGKAAGVGFDVPRGKIKIDPEYATAWVNDQDWNEFIAEVLGGADNDDALWVHQFIDSNDGSKTVLVWRSPNQSGEYITLEPTDDCHTIQWDTINGQKSWREVSSCTLPSRIDNQIVTYLDLVDEKSAGGLGEGQEYSVELMDLTIQRQIVNGAVLGSYCNVLMVTKAIWNSLPKNPPAKLEEVIDASVKTGANLGAVGEWCNKAKGTIVHRGIPVPTILHDRVSKMQPVVPTEGHWLDRIVNGVMAHIERIEAERSRIAKLTTPPTVVLDAGKDWQMLGKEFRKVYSSARIWDEKAQATVFSIEKAAEICEAYLMQYDLETRKKILLGAIFEAYMGENNLERKDGSAFQLGNIVAWTMEALRDTGYLRHIEDLADGGVITYELANDAEVSMPISVTNVWFNLYQAKNAKVSKMSDIQAATRAEYKNKVAMMVSSGELANRVYNIKIVGERKVITNASGIVIGYISKEDAGRLDASRTTIAVTHVTHDNDGNIRVIVKQ